MPTDPFIRVPKALINDSKYRSLSINAVLLYGLMDDRTRLSAANNWHDGNGEVYILFTICEVCKALKCGKDKACHTVAELESAGLITRHKRGRGNPAIIYVNSP